MIFEEILDDIEGLIGKTLNPVTPLTNPISVTRIDRDIQKYFIRIEGKSKETGRPFRELESIFLELTRKGFTNVEQALYGVGSSRHHPETIFANLPYIQHFKFKNKKHLLLRRKNIHESGELSGLQGSDLRSIRKKIENYMSLSHSSISLIQSEIITSLHTSLDTIFKKYPGDSVVVDAENALIKLNDLEKKISESIASLDILDTNENENENENEQLSLDALLDDESVTGIANINNEDEDEDEDVEALVPSGKPRIRQFTPTLSLIFDRLNFDEIELQPDFQRKDRIWEIPKKSKLIESILMGLPLPVFYFGEKSNGDWVVVDGLQRITTVFDFMRGGFELEKLESLPRFNGESFRTLDRSDQRKIREHQITSHLIDIDSDRENIIVELFHRINTYGVKLSDQEIRSALNQGSSVKFLRYIAGLKEFKTATTNKVKPHRQKDMDICLGAISFIVLGYKQFNYNKYDTFLTAAMKKLNTYKLSISNGQKIDKGNAVISDESSDYYKCLASKIMDSLSFSHEIFGGYAFKKELDMSKKVPISKPLFELIVTYFSQLDKHDKTLIRKNSAALLDCLYDAIDNDAEHFAKWTSEKYMNKKRGFNYSISTSTGKKVTVQYRFDAFKNILKESTGVDINVTPFILDENIK